jgi:hypothetical protein
LEVLHSLFAGFFPKQGPDARQLNEWLLDAVIAGHADVVAFLFDNGASMTAGSLALFTIRIKENSALFVVFEVLFERGLDLSESWGISRSIYWPVVFYHLMC